MSNNNRENPQILIYKIFKAITIELNLFFNLFKLALLKNYFKFIVSKEKTVKIFKNLVKI
jgi:hypothetical protein